MGCQPRRNQRPSGLTQGASHAAAIGALVRAPNERMSKTCKLLSSEDQKIAYLKSAVETVALPYLERLGNMDALRALVLEIKNRPVSQRRGEAISDNLVGFLGLPNTA